MPFPSQTAQANSTIDFPAKAASTGSSISPLLRVSEATAWRAARAAETGVLTSWVVGPSTADATVGDVIGDYTAAPGGIADHDPLTSLAAFGRPDLFVSYGGNGCYISAGTEDVAPYRVFGDTTFRWAGMMNQIGSSDALVAIWTFSTEYNLYLRPVTGANRLRVYWQGGTSGNYAVEWNLTGVANDRWLKAAYIVLQREDNGDSTCTYRLFVAVDGGELTQLTSIQTATGSSLVNNGDGTVTAPITTNGEDLARMRAFEDEGSIHSYAGVVANVLTLAEERAIYNDLLLELT